MFGWLRGRSGNGAARRTNEPEPEIPRRPELVAATDAALAAAAAVAASISDDEEEEDEEEDVPLRARSKFSHISCDDETSSQFKKQIEELRSHHTNREISPERSLDFDEVLQKDASLESTEAFSACLASIFRLRLEDVPTFIVQPEGDLSALRSWLFAQQRELEFVPLSDQIYTAWRLPSESDTVKWAGVLGVLRGGNPNGGSNTALYTHDVVVRVRSDGTFSIVHDPHPDGEGLASPLQWFAAFPPTEGACI